MSNVESETGEKDTTEAVENGVKENNEVADKKPEENVADLNTKIVRQIEYYFGDINLPRDRFLQEQIKLDDGWVPVEVMLKFKRLANLTTDTGKIVTALEGSDLMEINEDKTKLRRKTDRPLPVFNEDRRRELLSRSVYCKGFEQQGTTLDELLDYFNAFGGVENVQMRSYKDKATNSYTFKGSVFVTFATKELAAEFLNKESVKYKDVELIRKWQAVYIEDKRKERQEKKSSKGQSNKKPEEEKTQPKEEFPKGAYLHLKAISQETTREDINEKLISLGADVAFVHFNKGDAEAHIRLQGENSAKQFLEKLGDTKIEICGATLDVRSLEGEEEEEYIKKTRENIEKRRHRNNYRNKFGRKGGRGGRGGHGNKRKGSPVSGSPPPKRGAKSGSDTNADVIKIENSGDNDD